MKTENIYFATLSMVIGRNNLVTNRKTLNFKPIVVQKQGKYPEDKYCDLETGKTYRAYKKDMPSGTYFVDTLLPFRDITGNESKHLSRGKILVLYKKVRSRI